MIGDSISVGYGALGTAPCNFSTATESVFVTYGTLVATALEADLQVCQYVRDELLLNRRCCYVDLFYSCLSGLLTISKIVYS